MKIQRHKHKPTKVPSPNYILVDDDNCDSVFPQMEDLDIVALDIETTGLDPYEADILLIQIGNDRNQYIFDMKKFTNVDKLINYIRTRKYIIGHNLKFDLKFLFHNCG